MSFSRTVFLLFALNVVDAVITIIWVRNGLATEGNYLMATLIDHGDLSFLTIKIGMGVVTAVVLLYGAEYRVAKIGARIGIAAYSAAIVSHILTGFAAAGYLS